MPLDPNKVNSEIFGTPNLQELDEFPVQRSETHTTINTTDYETPAESLNDLSQDEGEDIDEANNVERYSGLSDDAAEVSTLKGVSPVEQQQAQHQAPLGGAAPITAGTAAELQRERSNISAVSNPDNYYTDEEVARVRSATDAYELDLQRTLSRISRKHHHPGEATPEDGILLSQLDWDGPDDQGNPQNWSLSKKWFVTMTAAGICLVVTFGSSLYVSGTFDLMAKLGVSQELVLAGLTLYLVGLALGPAIAAPLSEMFGRKVVYVTSLPISMLFIMGVGLSENIQSILVLRFFSGFFASPAMAVAGGTIADIWTPDMMGIAMSTFCLAPFLGPVIGPVIGGFVAERKGWKWCLWVNLMAAGAILPFVFWAEETYKGTIMRRRAKKRGIKIRSLMSTSEFIKVMMVVTLARPLQMLVVEPIVIVFSIYVAFVFAVLFGFFEAFPVIFRGTYEMELGVSGLPFLGIGVGLFIGTGFFIYLDRTYFCVINKDGTMGKKGKNGEPFKQTPESRLLICKVGAVVFPISMFWMGWCARPSVHWMAVVAAGVPFGFALVLIFFAVMLYFTMSYPPLSVASALAANNLARYVLSSVFPLFTVQMYENLGNGWASSVFGFIAVAMVPVPWIFERWGPSLRSKSTFGFDALKKEAQQDEEEEQEEAKAKMHDSLTSSNNETEEV